MWVRLGWNHQLTKLVKLSSLANCLLVSSSWLLVVVLVCGLWPVALLVVYYYIIIFFILFVGRHDEASILHRLDEN